jgi:membrane-bound metal-dependent hydrolase YbcI (DUF457 family)
MLTGHLAIAALLHHYLDTVPLPTIGGSLAPDLVDKGLYLALDVTDSGRTYGHTLLATAVSTVIIHLFWGRQAAQSWLVAYLSHLIADADGFVPWFYPWKQYRFKQSQRRSSVELVAQFFQPSPLELVLYLWLTLTWLRRR